MDYVALATLTQIRIRLTIRNQPAIHSGYSDVELVDHLGELKACGV